MDCTAVLRAVKDAGDLNNALPDAVHSQARQGREYQLAGKRNLSRATGKKMLAQRPCAFQDRANDAVRCSLAVKRNVSGYLL